MPSESVIGLRFASSDLEMAPSHFPSSAKRSPRFTARSTVRLLLVLIAMLSRGPAHGDAVADFYRGKTVSLIISTSVGGGYDTLGRAVARFLSRHVPGNPIVVVRNMPGAGGIIATNFIYNEPQRDGTIIGLLQDSAPFKSLLGMPEARYASPEFNWLGSPSAETGMLVVWGTTPVGSLGDARARDTTVGAAAVNSTPALYARLLNEVFGLRLKVIVGYPGQTEAFLAMERGEIDGYPSVFYSTLLATRPDWLPQKKIRAILYYGPDRHPELGDVPYASDLVTNETDKILMNAAFAPLALGKLFAMGPGVPPDRVAALRKALADTFADPEFVAENKRLRLGADAPRSGDEISRLIQRLYSAPQSALERLRGLNLTDR
jgi:tripartite-type tricarboxylate transporter receptor subunit TctC